MIFWLVLKLEIIVIIKLSSVSKWDLLCFGGIFCVLEVSSNFFTNFGRSRCGKGVTP
jgi:hypothetical protein